MSYKTRVTLTTIGCFISLIGTAIVPWFVITYNPPGGAANNGMFDSSLFAFSALFLLPYSSYISNLQSLFIAIGVTFIEGLLSFVNVKFIIKKVLPATNWIQLFLFLFTLLTNIVNKSVLLHLNNQFLMGFYGITDINYIMKYTTVHLGWGLFLTFTGFLISFMAVNESRLPRNINWDLVATVFTVMVVISSFVLCSFNQFNTLWFQSKCIDCNSYTMVYATKGWQDTGKLVKPNYRIGISYVPGSGTWTVNKGKVPPTDANGQPPTPPAWLSHLKGQPLPGVSSQALIAKIANGKPFLVGDGKQFMGYKLMRSSRDSGDLFLRINDSNAELSNNAGSIEVAISVFNFIDVTPTYGMVNPRHDPFVRRQL
jgi:hypothetical protein